MGFTPQWLSKVEEMRTIDDQLLDKIAKALDTDVNWFKMHDIDTIPTYWQCRALAE